MALAARRSYAARTHLDVERRLLERQQHVAVAPALRRLLPHLHNAHTLINMIVTLGRGGHQRHNLKARRTHLYERLDGALGDVEQRGSAPQVGALVHGRRRVDQEHDDGHGGAAAAAPRSTCRSPRSPPKTIYMRPPARRAARPPPRPQRLPPPRPAPTPPPRPRTRAPRRRSDVEVPRPEAVASSRRKLSALFPRRILSNATAYISAFRAIFYFFPKAPFFCFARDRERASRKPTTTFPARLLKLFSECPLRSIDRGKLRGKTSEFEKFERAERPRRRTVSRRGRVQRSIRCC